MADENRTSSGGPSDDPDTVLRELKKQAEYGKLFAATLTKDAAAIEGAVKALNKNRDDIDKNEKAYAAGDFLRKFADLRSRVDDRWPCLRRVLEDKADLADLVIRTYRQDIAQARAKLAEITEELAAAQSELASRTRELADKQAVLQSLMTLPAALATQLTTLTALDRRVQDASQDPLRAFEAYATADEIIRQFEEELFVPATDEFHELVFASWGDVVRTQRALADAQNTVSTLTGERSTAEQTVDDLTKDRIAELLRRWTAALLRPASRPSNEEVAEWATSTSH